MPKPATQHVYVFFINGIDPCCLGNLAGLCNYVHGLGFINTYYGQVYHAPWFISEIRKIRAGDPDARICVVGFSLGANAGRGMAWLLGGEGIYLDLLVGLSTNNKLDFSHQRPENVGRYVDVQVYGLEGAEAPDAAVKRLNLKGMVGHFGSPSHPETQEALARELMFLASMVPVAELPPPRGPFAPEQLPAPRLAPPQPMGRVRVGWELLDPAVHLRDVPILETGVSPALVEETVQEGREPRGHGHSQHKDNRKSGPHSGAQPGAGAHQPSTPTGP
jgi:hypothetical protein